MSFYQEMAEVADEMITEFGASATLSIPGSGNGTYDPDARTFTAAAATSATVKAAVFDYDEKYIDGTHIRVGDKRAFVSTVGAGRPAVGGTLVWGSTTYTVVAVKPLMPALVAVLWELQVRA